MTVAELLHCLIMFPQRGEVICNQLGIRGTFIEIEVDGIRYPLDSTRQQLPKDWFTQNAT